MAFSNCTGQDKKISEAAVDSTRVSAKSKTISSVSLESFDSFFEKFQKDSVFQKSRTRFPLKNIIVGDEGDKDVTKFVKLEEFKFISIFKDKSAKTKVKKTVLNPNKVKVQLQIEDTGLEQNFIFSNKSGNWALVFVVDNSD